MEFQPAESRSHTVLRALMSVALIAGVLLSSVALFPTSAPAASRQSNLSAPNIPATTIAGQPIGITGTVDRDAAQGPIRLLFYQNIRGTWVLQKTVNAKWSGWTSSTTKYVADVTLPYLGHWRVGASYSGGPEYASTYTFRDFYVGPKPGAELSAPNVPASVQRNQLFGVTGTVNRDAAKGRIRLLFYQNIRGTWVLQKTVNAKWSGWTSTQSKYVADVSLPYEGLWRVGASYSGNRDYPTTYTYRDFSIASPWPYPNCIVIDKSDRRLYWVRNGSLVKSYPVAIGKPSSPTPSATWRIDSKYHTDPNGIYGPRKMRMYRLSGGRFVYTAYNIHGTNNPASVGTQASAGCIRMYNADVLELFPQVPLGTMVVTRD